jgi:peptidyl-dipeptidase Dcp
LDKDAFEAFKSSHDICDKNLAHSFRYDLLAQGGQRPGMEMYRKFRGADPDKKPMLRARGLLKDAPAVEEAATEPTLKSEPKSGLSTKIAPGAPVNSPIKK